MIIIYKLYDVNCEDVFIKIITFSPVCKGCLDQSHNIDYRKYIKLTRSLIRAEIITNNTIEHIL